jgi:lipoate-protein ligase A
MESWEFIEAGPVEPAFNMASDEALLEWVGRTGAPALRWYAWTEAAASFGYFQRYEEIASWTRLRPLLRRPTGGGLVPHAADWTYAMAIPAGHAWHALRAPESYERMHQWLVRAFAACGLPTQLAECCEVAGPGQCFVGWEKSDVLQGGRKIAGAAQRRNRLGLLIQGSIQPIPSGVSRQTFAAALKRTASVDETVQWNPSDGAFLMPRAMELVRERYGVDAYHRRR